MSLVEYRKKRRFDVTSEPKGKRAPARRRKKLAFVVQKHRAAALHYDFRLEWKGVMLSWAVPKGPSYDPAVKRLAVRVEDHPLEYNEFEGIIPAGEYGGGTVMIWDEGTWIPETSDVDAALERGDLKLALEGKKLRGSWVLEWVNAEDITELAPRSVVSNRLMIEIARDEGGDMKKAADGDPPAVLEEIIRNPKLLAPAKKGGKKSVWHSNRTKPALS
jgi:bifunctional non-homologous end joining protein LigD